MNAIIKFRLQGRVAGLRLKRFNKRLIVLTTARAGREETRNSNLATQVKSHTVMPMRKKGPNIPSP